MATFINVLGRSSRKLGTRALQQSKGFRRLLCSGGEQGKTPLINSFPLSKEVPWLPKPTYAPSGVKQTHTNITTLDNGLRVASEPQFGQFCTVGVLLDSGSRYEAPYPSGITHFLEKVAFGGTAKYKDRDAILQMLEKHGGICDCQGSRDTLIYAISANSNGLEEVTELLSEVVLKPQLPIGEIEDTRLAVEYDIEMLSMKPDPEPLLVEMIHAAAFRNNTLGLPKFCPAESTQTIDQSTLYGYMDNYHTPDRMVLAGVGVDHDVLVEYAKKHFLEKSPVWVENRQLLTKPYDQDFSIAQYTGGIEKIERDLSSVSLGPTPLPDLAHLVIGLESCSHKDPDFIAFCVLNMLMGGGGSFSAGGPGKGMYTRLYLNVLNRFHWMYSATAYNHAYGDSGIFCIHASADPADLSSMAAIVIKELVNVQNGIGNVELNRAKTQLQSMLLMNLESRPVMFEDVGRQVLAANSRLMADHYYDEIGKIQSSDIVRVAQRMLSTKPCVAAYGNLSKLPSFEEIENGLASKSGKMSRKFSLFS